MARRSDPILTLHEAADRLGVHYMTVYRYVRTGRLDGVKDGAEWRVRAVDVDKLAAAPPPSRTRANKGRQYPRRFEDRMLAGDAAGAWSVIENAMASGVDPDRVYFDIVIPAMRHIGDLWEAGNVTVAQEHQASAVTMRTIGRLSPLLTRRGRKRGSIVLGAPPTDQHGVPIAILTDLLRGRGFRVYDLGDDVPVESFVETALGAERLIAVGVGATTDGNDRKIRAIVAAVRDAVVIPVILGGRAIRDAGHAAALGADGWAQTAPEAVALFDELARTGEVPEPYLARS